ncbi:MAG: tetratricopeptide repeat protein [Deltaproteobacteria bacterium]|nr:tetratricopeptide repeat protein [Deltaproteobacteria bacterium]
MKGWVYIITNKAMPGIIKVGFSMQDPELLAAELDHTGSPHPYIVDYEVLVDEPHDIEQKVHNRLRNHREGKEWFRCTTEEAIATIKEVVGANIYIEQFKRADREKAEAIKQQREYEEELRRVDRTIEDCSKAIQLNPNDADAYNNRGDAYAHKGQYDRTIKDCDKAIQLNPNLAAAYYNRGLAYKHKGQYDKAISDFQTACDMGFEEGCMALQMILE